MQTADCRLQTVDFVDWIMSSFPSLRASANHKQANQSAIQANLWVIFSLNRVQSFTAFSVNNGQHSIVEITVCSPQCILNWLILPPHSQGLSSNTRPSLRSPYGALRWETLGTKLTDFVAVDRNSFFKNTLASSFCTVNRKKRETQLQLRCRLVPRHHGQETFYH